ncbi:MAG: D-alanyl-D-alanine carboxypeptidase [Alphaproteobacteria bacterium]|nr:D-alanyl-D-alanine carboxypeptidase [Alphaproteobacteria bacterium]
MTVLFRTFCLSLGLLLALLGRPAGAVDTNAQQAMMIDYRTGAVLLQKRSDELMAPSSMSKLMTLYLLFDALKHGTVRLDDAFPVSEKAWRMGGSKMFVKVGDKVRVEDLIRGIIIQSGNDACVVVAEGLFHSEASFADAMTAKGVALGLKHSNFRNASGWPDPEHLMTAEDLVILARRLIADFPEFYHYFGETEFTYNGITQPNRNLLLERNLGVDGLKTGHTESGGFGIVISGMRDGKRLILAINGLHSMKERIEEAGHLLDWGFRDYDNIVLFKSGEVVTEIPVWLGDKPQVAMSIDHGIEITLPKRSKSGLKVAVEMLSPIPAPFAKGAVIGKLVVSAPEIETREYPLKAVEGVDRLGFFGRLVAAFKYVVWGPNG